MKISFDRKYLMYQIPVIILILDQLSKWMVRTNVSEGQTIKIFSWLNVHYLTNTGTLFSLFGDANFVLAVIALGVIVMLVYLIATSDNAWKIGFLITLGGAIGNTIDRVSFGYVIDFIQLPIWPVFNIADMSITCGIMILLYLSIKEQP